MAVHILGISAYYHDSAACLVRDGRIVAAVQEERFTRRKHDPDFPRHGVAYCLREGGIRIQDVDYVAFYEKPFLKFDRLLHSYLAYAPAGLPSFLKAVPIWIKEKIWMKAFMARELNYEGKILFPEHHESHAASAFFPSPFAEAAILSVDGVGEWTSTALGMGRGPALEIMEEMRFPHSLGLLYSAFTYYTGFTVNSGEYKLMGLAPYGEPKYADLIRRELIDLKEDGSFKLNMKYFNYGVGLTMTNHRFDKLFGGPPRQPEARLTRRDMDVARSIQAVTEEIMLRVARHLQRQTGARKLCLAGGVALNCVANGRILREGIFDDIWIQPAAGDAGGALGAALMAWHHYLGQPREPDGRHDSQSASHLGPRYGHAEIRQFLESGSMVFQELDDEELTDKVAGLMAEEKIVGWFQGRMEFGPRALGARSIIGDARSRGMQEAMNLKIKFRESFRPFAPCVLREHVHEWFEMRPNEDSPYMLLVAPVREKHRTPLSSAEQEFMRTDEDLLKRVRLARSAVPAITHLDYSARVQTVDARHGRYRRLLEKFHEKTGCPVIVNTSFNLSWEPIVNTPQEAYHTFMQSEMDVLVLENFVLEKRRQPLGFRAWDPAGATEACSDSPFADPRTGEPLVVTRQAAVNPKTGVRYAVENGIPRLFLPADDSPDTAAVNISALSLGEGVPVPGYENVDGVRALLEQGRRDVFERLLNEQIPFDARVAEVGCGAGRLVNFLAVAHRSVLGADACGRSLALAQDFATSHGIDRAVFAQMNPMRPGLREAFFDVVIITCAVGCAQDGRDVLGRVSKLAKPGGYVIMRLPGAGRFNQILGGLEAGNLEFVNAGPNAVGQGWTPDARLFAPQSRGTAMSRRWSRWRSMASGDREGGFFVVIARRR